MTQSLRWYPMLALGSFVAQDSTGAVYVAPMLANGERSTYDGEIVVLEEDTREADPALDAQTRRFLLVGQIADGFRSVLRSWLSESDLLEVDRRNKAEKSDSVCHTHDFCDSNMAMLEAFEKVTGRPLFVDGVIPDENSDLFNDAWEVAKVDGFSSWAPSDEDLAQLEQISANADLGVAHETDAKWLRLFVDRVRAGLVTPAPFDPSSDADRRK